MEFRCIDTVPREVKDYFTTRYGIRLKELKNYCFILGYKHGKIREIWLTPCITCRIIKDYRLIRRWGLKILNITPKGEYMPTNTFIQLYGDHASKNIVEIEDEAVVLNLFRRTFITIEDYKDGIREVGHDDYPFKIIRYKGISLGLVKKHDRGYISLLPEKFRDIIYL